MLILLSPSKKLDKRPPPEGAKPTQPELMDEGKALVNVLKRYSKEQIKNLMGLSPQLAELNYQRYQAFELPLTEKNAHPALFTFKGDVYENMAVESYSEDDLAFAQTHVRVLSGLYGVLRPLDLIHPYRLEMGTKLTTSRGETLYKFWGTRITEALNNEKPSVIVNLASQEYFKAVSPKALNAPVIHIDFKQIKGGKAKTIGLMAKRARGLMADYVIKNRLTDVEDLRKFNEGGYAFDAAASTNDAFVFIMKMD